MSPDVEAVINEMAENRAIVAFVVDTFGRRVLKGIVTMKEAIAAARKGTVKAGEIAQQDFPSTAPEAALEESLHMVAEGNIPVAVLDEQQRLLGIITRKALIQAIQVDNGNNGNESNGGANGKMEK